MRIKQCETAVSAFHAHAAAGKSSQQRERIVAFIARKGGDWSIAVSYTHLDVYKRQLCGNPECAKEHGRKSAKLRWG